MSATAGFPSALFLIVLGLSTAQGGNPPAQTGGVDAPGVGGEAKPAAPALASPELLPAPGVANEMAPNAGPMQELLAPPGEIRPVGATRGGLSNWIQYTRPGCCAPYGGNGAIQTELFLRTGGSLVVGGGLFNQILQDGWEVKGGGRSLFFNPEMSAAWTVEIGLGYIYNHAQGGNNIPILTTTPPPVPPGAPPPPPPVFTQAHLKVLNRTNASAGLGREWFYTYQGDAWKLGWRFGLDVSGVLGTSRADFTNIKHRTDIPFGFITAVHSDFEIPRGCCTMVTGFRVEWEHDWMDVLQTQNNSNISSLNLLLNFGVRY